MWSDALSSVSRPPTVLSAPLVRLAALTVLRSQPSGACTITTLAPAATGTMWIVPSSAADAVPALIAACCVGLGGSSVPDTRVVVSRWPAGAGLFVQPGAQLSVALPPPAPIAALPLPEPLGL